MQKLFIFFISLCGLFHFIHSHSWVQCTDYRIQNEAEVEVFSSAQCHGYARAWDQCCENSAFGEDRGFNYQPGSSGKICRNPLHAANNYTGDYSIASPMARYAPGQQASIFFILGNLDSILYTSLKSDL